MNIKILRKGFKESQFNPLYSRSHILILRILEEYGELYPSDLLYYAQQIRKSTFTHVLRTLEKHRLIKKWKGKYSITRRGKKHLNKVKKFYCELVGCNEG